MNTRRLFTLATIACLFFAGQSYAQVLISPSGGEPHESAALEIRSETGGLLIPNIELVKDVNNNKAVATQIPDPADGLMIFHNGYKADGTPSGLPKGLWYYDKPETGDGSWVVYSRIGSIYSSSLDNFAEMYEIREMGSGTPISLNNQFSTPWNTATQGQMGFGFSMADDATVQTETGTSATADQLVISSAAAYYTVDVATTIITNTSGNIVSGQLFVNNTPQSAIFFRHAFQTSGEYVNCSTSGIIQLYPTDKVDFRFKTSTAAETIFIEHLNVKLTKIGDI